MKWIRIRNIDDPEELTPGSAEGPESIGRAPTTAPVVRIRDVLLFPAGTAEGDWQGNPPRRDAALAAVWEVDEMLEQANVIAA